MEKAIAVAQEQQRESVLFIGTQFSILYTSMYSPADTSLLTGLHAVGQVRGWKVQQRVFVGGTCGSVHVESFNKIMRALGVLESKWDLIRQKLVRPT